MKSEDPVDVRDAIARIGEIQSRLEQTQTFRGYRAMAVATTGLLACLGAVIQRIWLPRPAASLSEWLGLWIAVAAVSLIVAGKDIARTLRDQTSPRRARSSRLAVRQFAPCLIAGAGLTWALLSAQPEAAWMLPGLWAICFSLGIFSSLSILPREGAVMGLHYLLTGFVCLRFGHSQHALAPWTMLVTFGVGQFISAFVLYVTIERPQETNDV